jgi:multisubunit Na+/H+ antiporter MnhE subunit
MARVVLTMAALDGIYLIALERVSMADAAAGALWAALFMWWVHPSRSAGHRRRLSLEQGWRALVLVGLVLPRAITAAVVTLRRVLGGSPGGEAGFIEVPFGARTHRGATVTALLESLAPGAVAVDIDTDRQVIVIHVMDRAGEDAARADRERSYRLYQRPVVP